VIGAVLAALNAVLFMLGIGADARVLDRFLASPVLGWVHTMGGGLASLVGSFQLWPAARARWRRAHVWLGRVYMLAVAASALAGLHFARTSVGGPIASVGFTALGLCWLGSAVLAYVSIRRGLAGAHRHWMIRNYAFTFAAVTLRIQLGPPLLAGLSMEQTIAVVAWSCWIPNLLAVEAWLRRRPALPPT
jgi:uncharacterized membrane protein